MGEPGPEEATEQEARGAVSAHAMHNSSAGGLRPLAKKILRLRSSLAVR